MTYTIGFSNIDNKNETAIHLREGLEAAAQELGVTLICRDNDLSTEKAKEYIAEFVDLSVDLAIIAHIDERSGMNLVMPLKRKNIPVISTLIEIPLTVYYGPDDYTAGQLVGDTLAQWINTHWGGQLDKLIVLTAYEILLSHQMRSEGALQKLLGQIDFHPNNILYLHDGTDPAVAGERVIGVLDDWMEYEHIVAITMNDYIAGGVLQAVHEAGRENHVILGSFDGTEFALKEFRKPRSPLIVSPAFFPKEYGKKIMRLALDMLEGRQVPRRNLIPPTLFTRESIENDTAKSTIDSVIP